MKITGLTTKLVEFPYSRPMGLSPGFDLRTGGCVLVFLASDQGPVGEGLTYTFNAQRITLINDMVQSLGPLVIGLDPRLSGSFLTRAAADVRREIAARHADPAVGQQRGLGAAAHQLLCELWRLAKAVHVDRRRR